MKFLLWLHDLEDSGDNTLKNEYDTFAMAEYVVVMRVDEGTMGIIGDILFQNYSCVGLWASFIVFIKSGTFVVCIPCIWNQFLVV